MHEMSIAQSILDIVDEYMTKENGRKLMEVAVEVGELVAVVPDSLTFCYEVLVENSPYRESKLSINIIPLTGTCSDCNYSFKIENFEFVCPNCKSSSIAVKGGQELRITHLEVE
jgi:hydrogenase nickel incorporation protein HypA/HybF